jgi:NAD dependent epimerase/dehydratase family enzyme
MSTDTKNAKKIVLPGGSGFLGRILAPYFKHSGYEVIVLSRNPCGKTVGVREVGWDGETIGTWANELEGSTAVANLAGRSVDCRYNARNRRLIMDSRVNSTR